VQIHRSPRNITSIASIAIAAAVVVTLAACGGGEQKNSASTATTTFVETAAPPVATAAITEGSGIFGSAQAAACDTDRPNVELALEAYLVLNGDGPATESDLVAAGLLREESVRYDIGVGNVIVPSPTGGCTS